MKRQHPDNPELFWCPKCEGYKERGEFYKAIRSKHGITSYCKNHVDAAANIRKKENRTAESERRKRWRTDNSQREIRTREAYYGTDYWKKYRVRYREANRDIANERRREGIANVTDKYVRVKLKQADIAVTPASINLKRQQIIMKRTLKEFKKWRGENEQREGKGSSPHLQCKAESPPHGLLRFGTA
jgi:hypothetical protein